MLPASRSPVLAQGCAPMTMAISGLELADLDALMEQAPDNLEARYLRAGLLARKGRSDEARQDYLEVIARDPAHFGALNDLGTLLYNTDFRSAARLAYAEAVKHHPDNPIGRINLANALLANGEHAAARTQYEAALAAAPDHPDAHQGLANLLQDLGEAEAAEAHRQHSYAARGVSTLPYRGEEPPRRVLLLVSAVGGNVPTRFLLDDSVFQTSVLAVEADTGATALPPHDLVFNAVGDADLCPDALDAAEIVLKRTPAPVVNPPAQVRRTGRAANAHDLAGLSGVTTPKVAIVPREAVAARAERFGFPLLLRSPGFHTGRYFERVQTLNGLDAALAALPGRDLMLIEPLDARDAAGRFRKFRVMVVDDRLYPLHLAISEAWKVHYFTADMAERPDHRAEEAAFLDDMAGVLGPRAMAGLEAIGRRLGLDYAGIDFGLGPDGEVLLFEANATMVVNPPDADPRWDYRRAPVAKILAAVREMLIARADAGPIAGSSPPGHWP
jgi:Flp pilus assembly protein TadD